MKKKDVLFLCQFFYPEYNSSATLPWDTARYLASRGWKVEALCGYPREYYKCGNTPDNEVKENVEIKRLHYLQLKRGKKLGRLINYFSFTIAVFLHIGYLKKFKTVIVYSNPPVLPFVALAANKLFGIKIIFVSYDVYPEVAYASGSLQPDGVIAKGMRFMNRRFFSRVSCVVALTKEMENFLLENRQSLSKAHVKVIPNWAHEGRVSVSNEILQKFGYVKEDFVVSYFGNMGICQDVETLLSAMELLKHKEHIRFLIVGHGGKKDYVSQKTRNMPNVQMLDFMTGTDFEEAVSVSSCGIVSLEKGLKGMCAPSKYYSYLQGGVPVVSIVEPDSYLALEAEKEKVGLTVGIGEGKKLACIIEKLASDSNLCHEMSCQAAELYRKKYAMNISLGKYETLIRRLTGKGYEE